MKNNKLNQINESIPNKKSHNIKKGNQQKRGGRSDTKRTLFFVSPIYKRRVYEKCNQFFCFLGPLAIRRGFGV